MPQKDPIGDWFRQRDWKPFDFQEKCWEHFAQGQSGILQVPTGSGKTLAAVGGPIRNWLAANSSIKTSAKIKGIRVLYISPLKALNRDITASIAEFVEGVGLDIRVELRTGDTSATTKKKQLRSLPEILVTTPESLSLLLSFPETRDQWSSLELIVLDEWHELLGSKRGVQTELGCSHLRRLAPQVRTWALSATVQNVEEAAWHAVGHKNFQVITSNIDRPVEVRCLLPESVDTFPWAGHLGLSMRDPLTEALDIDKSTLIFTNTRNQAERWFQEITKLFPEYEDQIALHHSSIDKKERIHIEESVQTGDIKWVVCTSSLDLGVDFTPVERVVQIGSVKAVARILQRAGRANHQPGRGSEVLFVPTHALEIAEVAALREAIEDKSIEPRVPIPEPKDVLVQHLMTLACGGGFSVDDTYQEVLSAACYSELSRESYDQCIRYLQKGGESLRAYPEFEKLVIEDGEARIRQPQIEKFHRMQIGTITSDESVVVKLKNGAVLGHVEESFISKFKKGDVFAFAGRVLEFQRLSGLIAHVKIAKRTSKRIPSWQGGRLPISHSLGQYLRKQMHQGLPNGAEAERACLQPILDVQKQISELPQEKSFLFEIYRDKEGCHLFGFPFEGYYVHEGIASLLVTRMARLGEGTFSISVNDYGFDILAPEDYQFEEVIRPELFSIENLEADILESLNLGELEQRQFRSVARVAGLVFQGYPGSHKSAKQLQASSSTFYQVFRKYDKDHILLKQSQHEVLHRVLNIQWIRKCLQSMSEKSLKIYETDRPSPLGFPLIVEFLSQRMSNESVMKRIERMKKNAEKRKKN